jgi:hypothetical protein
MSDNNYRQPELSVVPAMATWNQKSGGRSKPLPVIAPEEIEQGHVLYATDLAPIVHHPLIVARGAIARKKVLTLYLLASTRFTDWIEDRVVIPVSLDIANLNLGLEFSTGLRMDARRCVFDEAFHSFFTSKIEEEARAATGVEFETQVTPQFFRKIEQAIKRAPKEFRHLIPLGFAICSETLITGTLATLHRDENVVLGVRTMFLDHAQDESRHSALFAAVLETLLPQLTEKQTQFLLPLFPDFIRWFTEPDLNYFRAGLKTLGLDLTSYEIEQILYESYPQEVIDQIVVEAARPSVKILEVKGIFRDPKIRDAFAKRGLWK